MNRVLPELFGRSEEEVFDRLCAADATEALAKRAGEDPTPVLTAARLAVTLRRTRAGHLERLRAALDPAVPCSTCPSSSPASTGCVPSGRWPGPSAKSWVSDVSPARARSLDGPRIARRPSGLAEIIVACGPGGVGKTTTAAAAAAMAAARGGGKVLVLTIDPARRLADALGLEGIGNTVRRVPDEAFASAGVKARGELYAAMLDTKESWDALDPTPRPRRPHP